MGMYRACTGVWRGFGRMHRDLIGTLPPIMEKHMEHAWKFGVHSDISYRSFRVEGRICRRLVNKYGPHLPLGLYTLAG